MVRGGGGATALSSSATASSDNNDGATTIVAKELNLTVGSVLSSLWGSCGVVYILAKAIKHRYTTLASFIGIFILSLKKS